MAALNGLTSAMQPSKYLTSKPTAIGQGQPNIDHPQLRDLVVCPHERGVVSYLRDSDIVEQNLLASGAPIRTVAELSFTPSSLTALALGPNDEDTLYAAGGSWNADLHLSYHKGKSRRALWLKDTKLRGTLNNSVLLTKNHGSGVEPRVGVTNNDYTFRMYDCAVRTHGRGDASNGDGDEDEDDDGEMLECVGALALDNCVNYASISPSGRLLLSVGDSPNMYLHSISGSSQLSFYPVATLGIPLPTNTPPHYPTTRPSTFTASFATAFSSDSMHFAVGSQEGAVAVWDIRKVSQPMKVWQVDKMRGMGVGGLGAASGFISWDPSDWFNSRAPAWSVRNVKFLGGNRPDGKEYLVFTEHTSLMHIMNADTFEEEDIVRIPSRMADPQPPTPPMYPTDPDSELLNSPLSYIQLGLPASAFSAGPAHTLGTGKQPGWEWAQLEDEEDGLQPLALEDIIHGFSEESASEFDESEAMMDIDDLSSDGAGPSSLRRSTGRINGKRRTSARSRLDSIFQRSHRTPIYSHSNPQYMISDGYGFIAETAQLDYRMHDNDEDDDADAYHISHGLDIAGVCSDPTGMFMYVGTTKGIVEWGLA